MRLRNVRYAGLAAAVAVASLGAAGNNLRVVEADPDNAKLPADEAYVLQRIGDVKRETGDNKGAVAAFAEPTGNWCWHSA